jgi:glycosyltransferase involved in cell wall biosynthesis
VQRRSICLRASRAAHGLETLHSPPTLRSEAIARAHQGLRAIVTRCANISTYVDDSSAGDARFWMAITSDDTMTNEAGDVTHGSSDVLFVLHYPAFAGPHNRVLRVARPLAKLGWSVSIVLPTESGNAAPRLEAGGVEVIQTPLSRLRRLTDPRPNLVMLTAARREVDELRRIIRAKNAAVVVVGNLLMPHGAIAARLEGRAVVWQIVDTSVPRVLQIGAILAVRCLADAVVYGGRSLPQQHIGATRLRQSTFVISPPVDTATFIPDSHAGAAVRRELGISADALVVGQVAALNPTKGLDGFLRAAAIVAKALPRAAFVIVGSAHAAHASYLDELRRLERELGLEGRVHWAGDRSDTQRYYAAMDLFVVSSLPRSEGTTTTSMEALSCRVPVVATDVGAVREVVVDGLAGKLVPPLSDAALASAIIQLLENPEERRTLGSAGRRHVVENFDLQLCVSRYVEAFNAALRHRGSRAGR